MKNNKNIHLLAIHNFLDGFIPFAPIAILYFQRISGSFALGMSIFSIAMLSTAIFEVPTGILSDKIGRKFTVVLGAFFYMLAYIFYAIGLSYFFLAIGAILAGIGRSFYSGNNDALLYDTLRESGKEDEFEHYLGKISSSAHIALATSALFGGVVAHFSFSLAMWLSIIPQVINFVISFRFYEPKNHTKKLKSNIYSHFFDALGHFVKNKRLALLTITGVISFSIGESIYQFRSAFVEELWPVWAIGIVSVLANTWASLSYYYSGSLLKKYSSKTFVVGGKIYARVVGFLAFGFPTVFSPFLLSTTAVFHGVSWSARASLFQKEFTHHQRATMDSIRSLLNNLGVVVASLGVGLLADSIGPARTLFFAQFLLIVPILMYIQFFRMKQK